MSKEQDKIFFNSVFTVVGALVVMAIIFYISDVVIESGDSKKNNAGQKSVSAITEPVGQVAIDEASPVVEAKAEEVVEEAAEEMVAEAPASNETSGDVGEKIYKKLCVNCHGIASMAAMIPQTGDAAEWGPRIEKGIDALYSNAITGFTGSKGMMMPPRGGNPSLTDDEVKATVDYMVGQVQ